MTPDQLLRAWFENVWNKRNDGFVLEHMGCPCKIEGLPESARNPEGFIEFRKNLQAAISDMHIAVLESMEDGDRTIGTCRVTGTHTASKLPVEFCFAYTARIKEDKIVEANNIIDFLTMLAQAKVISEDALEQGLRA
ncbi:MAG: ester cyclase [Verrucomicrobia bacterium]|nr:ester cyclase [Verrucomicrobiota bacterium]